ncbi:MAG TPA: hypothetical protein PLM22_09705 [Candidatus Sabulitectum sp.]|nr:hypothetical protein [Candidatus Sabulitectum sp.]HPJ29197.1 hypothetical protein [Candidatus Sabulitectum sp.]
MDIFRLFSAAGAVAVIFIMLRKVLGEFSGPSREEEHRRLQEQFEREDRRITGRNTPRCPLCGGDTERYQYPHIRVWRCIRFPECRGFVKSSKGGPSYARKWRGR